MLIPDLPNIREFASSFTNYSASGQLPSYKQFAENDAIKTAAYTFATAGCGCSRTTW